MRIRIRGPEGQSTITLDESATIQELRAKISEKTALVSFDVKYGYPPEPLHLDQFGSTQVLTDIGTNLDGQQLTISKRETGNAPQPAAASSSQARHSTRSSGPGVQSPEPLSLTRKQNAAVENDPPEIHVPERGGAIVLRVMPDDNSCLFRAVGSAVLREMDTMTELRGVIADTIQAQPDIYPAVVLGQPPDNYCQWIKSEDSWGGQIELNILSQYFDMEICSIDVQSLRVDRYNEGRPFRCIIVYSGIHYDTIALSPYSHSYDSVQSDKTTFDAADSLILEKAVALCQILREKHYFTDTASFRIKCNRCGGLFVGERGASQHAAETGHSDFGEAS
ncbi:ubiquitin-specific protease otu1 [Onygenales sp. PD_40]|nr:ubiquitin-specific protease otu1 [Onygenales sp. PD_40]